MSERPFARVYYIDLERDYPTVYRDDHLYATWGRMLATAEAMWPVVPEIPRSAKAAYVRALTSVGLVIAVKPFGYRIKGLDAERTARSNAARNAARIKWGTADSTPTRTADRNASRARPNQPKPNQPKTNGSTTELSLESDEPTSEDWRSLTAAGEPR